MKKLLIILLASFSVDVYSYIDQGVIKSNVNNYAINYELNEESNNKDSDYTNQITKINNGNEIDYNLYTKTNYTRNYNYFYYNNSDNYNIKSKDDIKKAIYNGLNEGKTTITLYCAYDNCLDDFYSIYKNRSLMKSINNYVSPYNKFASIKYRININNGKTTIYLENEKYYTNQQIDEINNYLDRYLSKLKLDEMNDKKIIKWGHDFIINKDKYDLDAVKSGSKDAFSAYGAIVGNKAICKGYAEAMAIILDRFNIPNIMISSDDHVWNLVYVDDKWLHLDLTWDDPVVSTGENIKIYDYYLVTSNNLAKLDNSGSHTYNPEYYLETLNNV